VKMDEEGSGEVESAECVGAGGERAGRARRELGARKSENGRWGERRG